MSNQAIVLVGMPGAGKSTLGVQLAKELAKPFVDTDIDLQEQINCTLQEYMDEHGYLALREQEAICLQSKRYLGHVISTGGSAVYSDDAMQYLKEYGVVVFLQVSLDEIKRRVNNAGSRGIAAPQGMTFADIFNEREVLYNKYADIVLNLDGMNPQQALDALVKALS